MVVINIITMSIQVKPRGYHLLAQLAVVRVMPVMPVMLTAIRPYYHLNIPDQILYYQKDGYPILMQHRVRSITMIIILVR
jgi:hypothetical protein